MNIVKNINRDNAIVYILDIDSHVSKLQKFLRYLSDKEKDKAYKYRSELLVHRYIITRGFLRLILHWYTKQNPENIQIKIGSYGKPFIPNSKIRFNISHSNSIACYALTINQEIGVDIEFQSKDLNFEDLLDYVLSKEEIINFHALKDNEKFNTFYELWTKKEALVKATGDGLTYDITNISTMPFGEKSKVTLFYNQESIKKELYCYPISVPQNYSGFIATNRKIREILYMQIGQLLGGT
ncbi:MAG: 4'-phosphopantetheinyl transferase superfamily protein [Rickettsiaceae bacterium]